MGIMPHYDYETIPIRCWFKLIAWYGGGPMIKRNVVGGVGFFAADKQVELYPVTLSIELPPSSGTIGQCHAFSPSTKWLNVCSSASLSLSLTYM
jgi:hypothetical protein